MSDGSKSAEAVLEDAAKISGVQISQDLLDRVKNAPENGELRAWIQTNLKRETLLSSDELQLYELLEEHGLLPKPDKRSASLGRFPVTEADIGAAIKSLDASTRAIEVQNKTLRSQQALLDAQRNANSATSKNADNEAKLQQLHGDLQELQETSQRIIKTAPSIITERLKKDNRSLEHLQASYLPRLLRSTEPSTSEPRFEELLELLTTISTQEIKTRLDRVFLETLENASTNQSDAGDVDSEVLTTLESDLGSLYTEIEDVVSMSVNQQFREPLRKSLREARMQKAMQQQHLAQHVENELSGMTCNLNSLADTLELATSSQLTLQTLSQHLEALKQTARDTRDVEAKAQSEKIRPSRPAERAMLSHFGIAEHDQTASQIFSALENKVEKLRDLRNESYDGEERELTNAVSARQRALDILGRASSQSHAPLRDSLDALEQEIAGLQGQIEALAGQQDRQADLEREKFVDRWT